MTRDFLGGVGRGTPPAEGQEARARKYSHVDRGGPSFFQRFSGLSPLRAPLNECSITVAPVCLEQQAGFNCAFGTIFGVSGA